METKKNGKEKNFFCTGGGGGGMDWGGTNEFLSGKIASFIGGELRS